MTVLFRFLTFLAICSPGGTFAATTPQAEDAINIGVLAAQSGPYAEYGLEAKRGAELALAEFDGRAGGKPVQLIFETGDAAPEAIEARAKPW